MTLSNQDFFGNQKVGNGIPVEGKGKTGTDGSLPFPIGESGRGSAGWFWFNISLEAAIKLLVRATVN